MSYCENFDSFRDLETNNSCSGLGCCGVSIPRGIRGYSTHMTTYYNYSNSIDFNHCGFIFLAEQDRYNFSLSDLTSDRLKTQTLPIVLNWSIGAQSCENAKKNQILPYACRSDNSECTGANNLVGYLCNCSKGYQGNPYIAGGCRDLNECVQRPSVCPSEATCTNTVGSYSCNCSRGYRLNFDFPGGCEEIDECQQEPCKSNEYCENRDGSYQCKPRDGKLSRSLKLGLGIGGGSLALLFAGLLTCCAKQRRNLARHAKEVAESKKRMFEQNGGPLLEQQISSQPGNNFRIFTEQELAKATENFADKNILGKGGHGVVYLGKLEDNTYVAVKKWKMMNEREGKEFAREMAILSQINHVNVVKILGCCVEVEVPMLIYEFVSGGTLSQLIHGRKEGSPFSLGLCLRIASEVAEALAYLHSYASPPILHKDVKTANVLLDENNRAKISDFGASSFAPVDEVEIATVVQGTCGYLDPEFLRTSQFSDKSDVYSFGVVLVELLTRRSPIQLQMQKESKGLAVTFVSLLKQGKLDSILDPQITAEGDMETLTGISEIASRCLSVNREDRPTMIEVSRALHTRGPISKHPCVPPPAKEGEANRLIDCDQVASCASVLIWSSNVEMNSNILLDIDAGR